MPTSLANITWTFVPGSLSTLVEYRVDGSTTWIQPSSPTNPTLTNNYPIIINDNVLYNVRLTTNGVACAPRSMTFNIRAVVNNCCPVGYALSPDGTYCFQTNTTAATPPSSPQNTVAETLSNYTQYGTLIFNPGYNINGTGSFTQISYTNSFWVNGAGWPSGSGTTTSAGPMNRSGLWSATTTSNQDVGFTICITVPTGGVYYVGMGADNYASIALDGNVLVQMDPTVISAYLNANGYPGVTVASTFDFWFIYPVTLTSGNHVLTVIGHNVSGPAAMGAEIYNLTSSQIQSVTSYGTMGAGLIFSTKDYIGQPVQIGTGGGGYTCPSGYSLVLCSGPAFCTQTLTLPTQPCITTTTTTTTTTTSTSTTTSTTTSTSSSTTTTTTT